MEAKSVLLSKTTVLQTIKAMPAVFSIDDLISRLIVIGKIERGLGEMERGEGVSTDIAKEMLAKWFR